MVDILSRAKNSDPILDETNFLKFGFAIDTTREIAHEFHVASDPRTYVFYTEYGNVSVRSGGGVATP